jgi:hypothetical protein
MDLLCCRVEALLPARSSSRLCVGGAESGRASTSIVPKRFNFLWSRIRRMRTLLCIIASDDIWRRNTD